ncbi:hypothetical protein IGI86_001173 [Enterococcus sp. AZ188]|uniref:SpaA isopeptide-forming pilin-related protein n=1 Tax=Enterococcus sp. AZ188 TaxID=2774678 RepID=UPI003D2FAEBF
MFLTKRHHWFSFIFCMLGGILFFIYSSLQTNGTASAQEENTIAITETEQIKLTGQREGNQFTLRYQLSQKNKQQRIWLQLYALDETKEQPLTKTNNKEVVFIEDESAQSWLTTQDFLQTPCEQEVTFQLPSETKKLKLAIQIEEYDHENQESHKLASLDELIVDIPLATESASSDRVEVSSTDSQAAETGTESTSEQVSNEDSKGVSNEETQEETKETGTTTSSSEDETLIEPFKQERLYQKTTVSQAFASIEPDYTTDQSGTYPSANWTIDEKSNVLNHQGNKDAGETWDGVATWNGDPENLINSYIEYGGVGDEADFALRKFAKETNTPGLFDVYLNVRGNVQRQIDPIDVVLVVDWSGSMNEMGRITEVKKGVDRFLNQIEGSGIQDSVYMGYVGYSSDGNNYQNKTCQLGKFSEVKETIRTMTPETAAGGTFTQRGLRQAGDMLSTQNGHKKVIVLLTDGVPTYSYHVSKVHTQADGSYYGTAFSLSQDQPMNTSHLYNGYFASDQYGNSKWINNTFVATIGEAMALKERGIEIHGLGIQLQGDQTAGYTKADVENKMRQMVSADEEGHLYYESANEAADIADYLEKKALHISATVTDGEITDPISQPFLYEENSLSIKSVGSAALTVQPEVTISDNTLNASGLYLGEGQELQIHYQVRIQTEAADFKPDTWYQMNGETVFYPNHQSDQKALFGVPSAKAPGKELTIKKVWEEYDGDTSSRPESVYFEISRSPVTSKESWQTGYLKLTETDAQDQTSWERSKVSAVSEKDGTDYEETRLLPLYNNQGETFNYQVTNELAVSGYESTRVDVSTWKNTKTFVPLALNLIKKSAVGEVKLTGAVFELTGAGKTVTLVDQGDGTYGLPADTTLQKSQTYRLKEVTAPAGHHLAKQTEWLIHIDEQGHATIDGQPVTLVEHTITLEITNPFKEIPVAIRKYTLQNEQQVLLAGAVFSLQQKTAGGDYQEIASETSDDVGMAEFTILEPGAYRISETAGPLGYDTVAGDYEFVVGTDGKIQYQGENVDGDANCWTLTHGNQLKPFDLVVNKQDELGQALEGAKFRLSGNGRTVELPENGEALAVFHFQDLTPGSYTLEETGTPAGYAGLTAPVQIKIEEDGQVFIDEERLPNLLVSGEKNNQIELIVTNQVKVSLPETGGNWHGWMVILSASLLVLLAGSYLHVKRKDKPSLK